MISAAIGSFMVCIQTKLDQYSNGETAALLRILVYNANKTAFGDGVPQIPQVPGVPPVLSSSEYILYLAVLLALGSGAIAVLIIIISSMAPEYMFSPGLFSFFRFMIWILHVGLGGGFLFALIGITLQVPVAVRPPS